MTSLSDLSNEELRVSIRDHIRELERRLKAAGRANLLALAKAAHLILAEIERRLFNSGDVQTRSGGTGDPKPEEV